MADSMNAAKLLESGNIRSPRGRLLYPSLFKPSLAKGETDKEKARYGVTILFPKSADLKLIIDAAKKCRDDNFSAAVQKQAKIKMPFLKTEDQPRFAELADTFPVMIRCFAKFAPEVVGPTNRRITEEEEADEVYSGRWGRISLRPFSYDMPTSKGVSLGLQNVQLLEHDEPMGGGRVKAETEFEAVGDELADLEG